MAPKSPDLIGFNLEKGDRQGNPVAANILISALEVVSVFTESNENIKCRKSFKHIFLYTALLYF